MRNTRELLRREPATRLFFLALTQSALGTGAGYVALLLITYQRLHSPWAISLVLVADLVPAMFLGPLFGAIADRWSRRGCMIAADALRALAFAGIAIVPHFSATVALAALAGIGTGLFRPAALAGLPGLVSRERLPAATSLYGAITDVGNTAGPAVAAGILAFGGPRTIMVLNAITFAVSAVLLSRLRFGAAPSPALADDVATGTVSLLRSAREGLRATAGMRGVRVVILASASALFCAGMFNVAELPFARQELDASDVGFGVLVASFGVGFVGGSLRGSGGGDSARLVRRFLLGLMLMGAALVCLAAVSAFALALVVFVVAGFGNGFVLVYERLFIQRTVPDELLGRVFGIKDGLTAWAFALAFLAAGGLLDGIGIRPMFVVAGSLGLVVWLVASHALRGIGSGPDVSRAQADARTAAAERAGV